MEKWTKFCRGDNGIRNPNGNLKQITVLLTFKCKKDSILSNFVMPMQPMSPNLEAAMINSRQQVAVHDLLT